MNMDGLFIFMRCRPDPSALLPHFTPFGDPYPWVLEPDVLLPPHDHRDNFNGGFAFACFHPGTSLPQQPWAI